MGTCNGFDHLPFRITIRHNAFTQLITTLRQPAGINTKMIVDFKFSEETRASIFEDIWAQYDSAYTICIQHEDVDGAHRTWCQAAEHYCHRLEQLCSDVASSRIPKLCRDQLLQFEIKKLTVDWNKTQVTIDSH